MLPRTTLDMAKPLMDGSRIREHLGSEVQALLTTYEQFAGLVPHASTAGAAHRGEDGRYVESLVRSYLRKVLPTSLEVTSGFILRPAVKTGDNGRERRGEKDSHSTQLDIIVYDSANYPVFQRFADNVIVPPEGVLAIVSVKKHLRPRDVVAECTVLRSAAQLCRCLDSRNNPIRGPFLGIASIKTEGFNTSSQLSESIFAEVQKAYKSDDPPTFDEVVGYIGAFSEASVYKARPIGDTVQSAKFMGIEHKKDEHHWGLQMLLTGILSVLYDSSRSDLRRPGFSGFESGRKHDIDLGTTEVRGLR
jgi:hypothetical protein